MLKLVIDTNVVISSLLKPDSNPALILSLIIHENCRFCLTEKIFKEYEEVLERDKFKNLDGESVRKLLSLLKNKALWVIPKIPVKDVAKDPADNIFLECALESKADFLITGNIQHFPERKFHKTSIVTPGEFAAHIAKIIQQG